jgi:hypothetical protein
MKDVALCLFVRLVSASLASAFAGGSIPDGFAVLMISSIVFLFSFLVVDFSCVCLLAFC